MWVNAKQGKSINPCKNALNLLMVANIKKKADANLNIFDQIYINAISSYVLQARIHGCIQHHIFHIHKFSYFYVSSPGELKGFSCVYRTGRTNHTCISLQLLSQPLLALFKHNMGHKLLNTCKCFSTHLAGI